MVIMSCNSDCCLRGYVSLRSGMSSNSFEFLLASSFFLFYGVGSHLGTVAQLAEMGES